MTSFLQTLKNDLAFGSNEQARQSAESDVDYTSIPLYFFELQVLGDSYLFPLTLGILSLTLSEPFSMEPTMTQQGGLFVEEQGQVMRRLSIRGDTGFYPTTLRSGNNPLLAQPADRSFGRRLPKQSGNALSGQRQLQMLQDNVFRLYGDFKRDPNKSAFTKMFFYDNQAHESWQVAPVSFTYDRSASQPLHNPYAIELLILQRADYKALATLSPDTSIFTTLRDQTASLTSLSSRLIACIRDISSVQRQLTLAVHQVAHVVSQAQDVFDATNALLQGTEDLIRAPYASIFALAQDAEAAVLLAYQLRATGAAVADWPEAIKNRFLLVVTLCEQLSMQPQLFSQTPSATQFTGVQAAFANPGGQGMPPIATSFGNLKAQGSSVTASDAAITANQFIAKPKSFSKSFTYQVKLGDSLTTLAAKFLGDPNAWQSIAEINRMLSPIFPTATAASRAYTDDARPRGILVVGQTLFIPDSQSGSTAGVASTNTFLKNDAVIGAKPYDTADAMLYGRDLAYSQTPHGLDLALSQTLGSTDLAVTGGTPNASQAIQTRILTEQGTAALYPSLGLGKVVGFGNKSLDTQALQLRVSQSVAADPRVAQVKDIKVSLGASADAYVVDVSVVLVGQSTTSQVSVKVG
jgi:hypothetical protein